MIESGGFRACFDECPIAAPLVGRRMLADRAGNADQVRFALPVVESTRHHIQGVKRAPASRGCCHPLSGFSLELAAFDSLGGSEAASGRFGLPAGATSSLGVAIALRSS